MLGRVDPLKVLLPLHLAVDNWKEPDVDEGQKPILLYATVTVESLSANKKYTIVRYDDIANIPTDSSFLSGKYDYKHEFTYNGNSNVGDKGVYIWKDPNGIVSDTSANYFCMESK